MPHTESSRVLVIALLIVLALVVMNLLWLGG